MHILHVVGARPNFMKAAPLVAAMAAKGTGQSLVHTGQHYDVKMSEVFFEQLGMPAPDVNLGVGSGTHAVQTAQIMCRIEPILIERNPDLVLVYGDVNSTVAAALVCSKLQIRVGHVEAGLRSWDRTMPEEINRVITDQLADLLFTPSADADENLKREGIAPGRIHLVGNVMIDTLVRLLPRCQRPPDLPLRYALVTLHRPSNVDDPDRLSGLLRALDEMSRDLPVVFPVHPRTRQRIADLRIPVASNGCFRLLEPQPYLEFLALQQKAAVVITDSGGMQEETSFMGVPCLTLRENTERPITTSLGTNLLIGHDLGRLKAEVRRILSGESKKASAIPLWDGHAADRIASIIAAQA